MTTETIVITGGKKLNGRVSVQGSKNAALPKLAACILIEGEVTLYNVPDIKDIRSMLSILEALGASYAFELGVVTIDCTGIQNHPISEELTSKLRASSLLLGPMIARFGKTALGMPGGCAIGSRPMDIHFKGFEKLGAKTEIKNGMIYVDAPNLEGEYTLHMSSVGATENLVMASVFTKKEVILNNIAIEPEVMEMVHFLQKAGANIETHLETKTLVIRPTEGLRNLEFRVQPDRIEASTIICAAVASKGSVELVDVNPQYMKAFLEKCTEAGIHIETTENTIIASYVDPLKGIEISTSVYPGFPTDSQPQMVAMLSQATSSSFVTENLFENRFRYTSELRKMNAKMTVETHSVYIQPSELSGCKVEGFDLRGTASLIIASLGAEGITTVTGLNHLYRGYESFISKLKHLGADIFYI